MGGLSSVFRALVLGPGAAAPAACAPAGAGRRDRRRRRGGDPPRQRSVTESFRDAAASISGRSDFVVTGAAGVPVEALERLSFLWDVGSFAPAVTGCGGRRRRTRESSSQILGSTPAATAPSETSRSSRTARASRARAPLGRRRLRPGAVRAAPRARSGRRAHAASPAAGRTGFGSPASSRSPASRAPRAATSLVTDLFTAQRILGKAGLVDRVDIVLAPGRRPRARSAGDLAAALAPGLTLEPPTRAAATADRMVRAFRFNLNALGSLTLLVGMFLIANAVSISVLRRRPEIATLRAIGTSRAMLFGVFLLEGLAVGIAGTALGEAGGALLSRAALRAVGGDGDRASTCRRRTSPPSAFAGPALLAGAVGLLAAVAAAALPAAEAMRVAPAPAMRAGSIEGVRQRRLRGRAIAAAVLARRGRSPPRRRPPWTDFPVFGFAAVALVVAALALVAPLLVRAAARAFVGPLARLFGPTGPPRGRLLRRLARAQRHRRHGARHGARHDARDDRDGRFDPRDRARLGRVDAALGPLGQGRRREERSGIVGDLPADVVAFLREQPGVAAVDPFRARDQVDAAGPAVHAGLGRLPRRGPRSAASRSSTARDPRARRRGGRASAARSSSPSPSRAVSASAPADAVTVATPAGPRASRVAGVYRDYSNDRGTVAPRPRALPRALRRPARHERRRARGAGRRRQPTCAGGSSTAASGRYALSISTNRELRREVLRIFDRTFAVTRALEAIAVARRDPRRSPTRSSPPPSSGGAPSGCCARSGPRRRRSAARAPRGGAHRRSTAAAAALPAAAAFALLLLAVINPQSFGWTVVPASRSRASLAASALVARRVGPRGRRIRAGSRRRWIRRPRSQEE